MEFGKSTIMKFMMDKLKLRKQLDILIIILNKIIKLKKKNRKFNV
jgi:hypothetical protein